jgi:hypothetical protein
LSSSVALVGSGVYLLAMAATGYYVLLGGSWGKTVQAVLLFSALSCSPWSCSQHRAPAAGVRQQTLLPVSLDYREAGYVHRPAVELGAAPDAAAAVHPRAGRPRQARQILWLRNGHGYTRGAGTCETTATEPFERFAFLGQTGWIVDVAEWRSAQAGDGDPLPGGSIGWRRVARGAAHLANGCSASSCSRGARVVEIDWKCATS